MRHRDDLLDEALAAPEPALAYRVSRWLASIDPNRALLEAEDCGFDVETFAAGGQCLARPAAVPHPRVLTLWHGPEEGLHRRAQNAWFIVSWEGHSLDVLIMTWGHGYQKTPGYWILADTMEVAERFYQAVCEWCAEVRGEVLVFDGGQWFKSRELYRSIQNATFANLILPGSLKQEILDDLQQFFAARETYHEHGVPWKRGILFIGPPGNGKTHTVKALINALGQPCLYVKSLKTEYGTDHDCIRSVFERARHTTPCLLVLEDLDSLLDDGNRSFFLNELDGFAANEGIVTLATTNHPERLDRAILDRPSRFDRKYHFPLPGPEERLAYIGLWNEGLKPALRLAEAEVGEVGEWTDEFSYAYIKELFLSSIMRWIAAPQPGRMPALVQEQAALLREQMTSAAEEAVEEFSLDEDPNSAATQLAMMRMAAMRASRRWR